MGHPLASIDGQLLRAVGRRSGRRQNLADPVRRKLEGRRIRQVRHSFATPAGEVWDQDIAFQVELGLVQENPAAGSTAAAHEGTVQLPGEHGGYERVLRRRPWLRHEGAVDQLRDDVLRRREDILVGCAAFRGLAHEAIVSSKNKTAS
jgi:hypothetical protein